MFKIKINDRTHFAQVQLALLSHGYFWRDGSSDLRYLEDKLPEHLLVKGSRFQYGSSYDTCIDEYTVEVCKTSRAYSYKLHPVPKLRMWRLGSKLGNVIVARDAKCYDVVLLTIVENGARRYGVKQALEELGYDTSGHEWDPEGRIVFN